MTDKPDIPDDLPAASRPAHGGSFTRAADDTLTIVESTLPPAEEPADAASANDDSAAPARRKSVAKGTDATPAPETPAGADDAGEQKA